MGGPALLQQMDSGATRQCPSRAEPGQQEGASHSGSLGGQGFPFCGLSARKEPVSLRIHR